VTDIRQPVVISGARGIEPGRRLSPVNSLMEFVEAMKPSLGVVGCPRVSVVGRPFILRFALALASFCTYLTSAWWALGTSAKLRHDGCRNGAPRRLWSSGWGDGTRAANLVMDG
jgi:hypothetical protein